MSDSSEESGGVCAHHRSGSFTDRVFICPLLSPFAIADTTILINFEDACPLSPSTLMVSAGTPPIYSAWSSDQIITKPTPLKFLLVSCNMHLQGAIPHDFIVITSGHVQRLILMVLTFFYFCAKFRARRRSFQDKGEYRPEPALDIPRSGRAGLVGGGLQRVGGTGSSALRL